MSLPEPISDGPKLDASPTVRVGEIVSGKFRVERILGEGGMGVVVEATHLQLDERVALKFLHRSAMAQKDLVSRFSQEARATAKLKSEYAARVIDVGAREDGAPYIVMEYLEGADLGGLLNKSGPLPVQDAVEYIVQACEAVAEAHARGIVHRDLKPENLFCVERDDGRRFIKVLDFGISKANLTGRTSDVNVSGHDTTTLMGSPFYMSPEQLRSTKIVDHRADIWSLGATLFEVLTGTTAFDHEKQFTELVAEILESPHRKLRKHCPHAPEGLEQIIDRCLEKDREKRFKTAAELSIALLPYAPRRARAAAERAAALMRAAGLTDPNLRLPPSQFPPPDEGSVSGVMDAIRKHSDTVPAPPDGMAAKPNVVTSSTASGAALAHDYSGKSEQRGNRSAVIAIAALMVVLGIAAAVYFTRSRSSQPLHADPVTASPPPSASVETAPSSSVPSEPAPPTASAATTDKEASPKASASISPKGPRWVPTKSTKASASAGAAASSAPASPDLEIRRER